MKRAFLRNLSLHTRNLLSSPKPKTNSNPSLPLSFSVTSSRLRFYSSESDSSSKPNFNDQTHKPTPSVENVDCISEQELKKMVDKYYEGDEDQVPVIFEAILRRKLAGITDDDNLLKSIGLKDEDDNSNELDESESDADYDSDYDSGSDTE